MSQTVVQEQGIGFAGMKADSGFGDVVSAKCEVAIPFGKLAVRGTAEDQAKLPTVAGDIDPLKALGVATHTHAQMQNPAVPNGQYEQKEVGGFMKKGRILVQVEEAVVAGDPCFVRYAAGGLGLGSFGKVAGASLRAELQGAMYVTGAAANGLAVVEISIGGGL